MNLPKIQRENLKKIRKIGHGSFGIVDLVEDEETGKQYAAKKIKRGNQEALSITREIKSYSKVDNFAVIKFYGYYPPDPQNGHNYHMLLFEYIPNGSLQDILSNKCELSLTQKIIILYGIAAGMDYLHSQEIIHRDLKPANILIDEKLYPKICDFGLSFVSDSHMIKERMEEFTGTPKYEAPEILKYEPYSYKVDIYAFAILAYELISGKSFCPNKTSKIVINGIRPNLSGINGEFHYILSKCWSENPLNRPTFSEIMDDLIEFIKDGTFPDFDFVAFYTYVNLLDKKKKNSNLYQKIIKNDEFSLLLKAYMFYEGNGAPLDHKMSAKCYKEAADLGSNEGAFKYAKMCLFGDGISIDKDEGLKYLQKSIDSGYSPSIYFYGIKLFSGTSGFKQDISKGIYYIKMAADKGYRDYGFLGIITRDGIGVPPDKKAAAQYLKNSADRGDHISAYEYGCMIFNEAESDEDKNIGIIYLKIAADQGLDIAMFTYGNIMYMIKNKAEAIKYFAMAANQGHIESMYRYSVILFKGDGLPPDKIKARRYFKIISKRTDSDSLFYYGMMILHGMPDDSSNIDRDKAINCIKKAADMEMVEANYVYVAMNLYGYHIPIDDKLAAKYLKFAADHDHVEASYLYFVLLSLNKTNVNESEIKYYREKYSKLVKYKFEHAYIVGQNAYYISKYRNKGRFLEMDPSKKSSTYAYYSFFESIHKIESLSFKKAKDSADNGNIESMRETGEMLKMGNGTEIDKKEACRYFKMAADKKDKNSIFHYGIMLFEGDGIKQNKAEGIKYIRESAELGCPMGKYEYAKILLNGDGIEANKQKAIKYLKEAAEINEKAMFMYGKMLINGDGMDVNIEKGINYIECSLTSCGEEELLEYALMLYNGDKIPMNREKAALYFQSIIAKTNNETAMIKLAFMLKDGDGIPENKEKAFLYFKLLSYQGNKEAMYEYAHMSNEKKNIKESLKYIKISADLGNIKSMIYYARGLWNYDLKQTEKVNNVFDKTADKKQIDLLTEDLFIYNKDMKKEAFKYYKMAADLGNEEGMIMCSLYYLDNEYNQYDREKHLKYLKMAVDCKCYDDAMYLYGVEIYKNGDQNEGLKYIKALAIKGNIYAMLTYGLFSLMSNESKSNIEESIEFIKRSADLENPDASLIYGNILLNGTYVPINKEEAAKYLKFAANQENEIAMLNYGMLLIENNENQVKVEIGINYIKKSADLGNIYACYEYAKICLEGEIAKKDLKEAEKYFKIAADGEHDYAMFKYSMLLLCSDNAEENINEIIKYLKKSADLGNILSCYEYANIYLTGELAKKDLKQAEKYFKISADGGHDYAMFSYSMLLLNSDNAKENINEIIKYLKKSADLGNDEALCEYGTFLYQGILFPKDKKEGVKLLKKSADMGCPRAALFYGLILLIIEGNAKESSHYFQFAISQNEVYDKIIRYFMFYYQQNYY